MKRILSMLAACLSLASCAKVSNKMVVTNHSGTMAQKVVVTVCGKSLDITNLPDGGSASARFSVKGDSGFQVDVMLKDGASISTNLGYVTGGAGAYGNHAEIEITKDRQIIGRQK